jgi:serine/threonine protein phosphatase PrpC
MPLSVFIGHATETGHRERNEDYAAAVTTEGDSLATRGVLAVLADGMGGGWHGREAAESTVRNLCADYYATPETWDMPKALERVILAANRWLHGQALSRREPGGMATTLSALALRGRRYVIAHVGDSRIYRLRDWELALLTRDHVWDRPDMRHVLTRAVGLDAQIHVDSDEGELHQGDVFLLVSDGVWEPLGQQRLHELLLTYGQHPDSAAREIVKEALRAGGQDNATALVARVESLPEENLAANLLDLTALPAPGRLGPGALIDGLRVEAILHDSRETLLALVRDDQGQPFVLKTLSPLAADDAELRRRLVQEEWLARRVQSHYFPQVTPRAQRHFLYYLLTWHDGATLQQRLDAGGHFSVPDAASLGIRLLKGLGALHRLDIVHRDIKPANAHLGIDGKLRILDLGVACCDNLGLGEDTPTAGTPSYMAPEMFGGARANPQTDLYAAGVTLYHLLTRKYPYGEVEPFQHPRFGEPVPPSRYRPDIPGWLENVILRAVARNPRNRFETAEEMRLGLERGGSRELSRPPPTPLAERSPLRLWQAVAAMSLIANLLLLWLLLTG